VFAFDVTAPLAAVTGLLGIGMVLRWPVWWVSVCSVLVLLIAEAVVVNGVLLRRDAVTVGTDDDGPALRLIVVAVSAAVLVATVLTGYLRWTEPDRDFERDSSEVVQLASTMAEATATFNPQEPAAGAKKAAALMVPERAEPFEKEVVNSGADLARRNVTARAVTLSGGLEALGPSVASTAVILRVTQDAEGQPSERAVVALRVSLIKRDGDWMVLDVAPIRQRG
jgi:hypothetical protein